MTGSPNSTGRFAFPLFTLLDGMEKLPGGRMDGARAASGRVEAKEASSIRLDRLFDIFFESYWCRSAGFSEVALAGTLTGKVRIEIRRRYALDGQEYLISSADFEGQAQSIEVPVALEQPTGDESASYLVAILHLAADAELRDLRWCVSTAPVRQVRIAGVICTFNQEDMLASNLTRIATELPFLHRLFVINQGTPNLAARIAPEIESQTPVTFIDQPNFGGAGGFTRGIIESLDDPQITHILLMDDDIEAYPSLLARIATILTYAGERHCIGGAMLDIHAPARLFTCGDRLNPDRPAIINIAPEKACDDVTTDAGRDFVARHHKPDFNGWWCFAFPVEAVRQCGLPLPLFIRGDDVEFGLRLSRTGFPTISWPGVAVWHLPFRLKVQPWQAFYDRRNMLFLNEAHGLFSRSRLARSAWGSFCNAIMASDYARARAIIEGISAFNKGPLHLENWSGEDHSALLRRMQNSSASMGALPPLTPSQADAQPVAGENARTVRRHDWWKRIVLSTHAALAIGTLRWRRACDPDAIIRLTQLDFWRVYLSMPQKGNPPLRDKGFASHPDDGIALPDTSKRKV